MQVIQYRPVIVAFAMHKLEVVGGILPSMRNNLQK